MNKTVLIAGAGPVGLVMAAELARYGVSVRIVEKAAQRTDKSKALVVWSRTLEMMDRMGCTASFLAAGMKVTSSNISAGSKRIAHISLDHVATSYPFALMIPQSETERLLDEHLNICGVKVERRVELSSFVANSDGVSSTLRYEDGHEETVESGWLIGCDGAHSTVRHQMGFEFVGDTMPSNWILADLNLSGVPHAAEIDVYWHADGVLAIFPITAGRYRVIADIGDAEEGTALHDPSLEKVQSLLDQRGPGGIMASMPIWLAGFHINERKVAEYRAGRVFLVGDAAHIHSPAGGQGMNTGIQDACNLAWKLALVCRGVCREEPLLASYSIERSAVGEMVLKAAGRMTALGIMKGEIKQTLRNHLAGLVFGMFPVQKKLADAASEISIGYAVSPLNGGEASLSTGPQEGERAPIRQNERPVGAGPTPRFALFANREDGRAKQLAALYPTLLESSLREPFHEDGIWLVRPDGYVALAVTRDRCEAVAEYLDRIVAIAN